MVDRRDKIAHKGISGAKASKSFSLSVAGLVAHPRTVDTILEILGGRGAKEPVNSSVNQWTCPRRPNYKPPNPFHY